MELPEFTCSFKGGMNKDISPNEYPNTCYFDAVNFRVITDSSEGMTTGALVTPRGTLASFSLPSDGVTTHLVMLGYILLRDCLVVLAHDTIGVVLPDRVYRIPLSELTTAQDITLDNVSYWQPGTHYLVYQEDLNFSVSHPIRVVGNYENADVQKIYWVDGLNPLRHLNIVNSAFNDLVSLDPQLLEIMPNHTYGTYELREVVGGHLRAGRIQYSYQLYSVSGTETMFAPTSNLYNLTTYQITDGIDFLGNELETEVNKSVVVTINLTTGTINTFNRIRLVALQYEAYGDIPTVRVVAEQSLGTTSVVFTDSGNSIGELVLEEFQAIRNEITPVTIETKNNYLFAANITQEYFDVDKLVSGYLDTRAYRWRYVESGGGIAYGTEQLTMTTDPVGALGYPPYHGGVDPCFGPVGIIHMTDVSWKITFDIGAEIDAVAHGWTFDSIASIDDTISIALYNDIDGDWTRVLELSMTGMIIDSYATPGTIVVRGTSYVGDKPSELIPSYYTHPTPYSDCVVWRTMYTYNYTYILPAGPSHYGCVLNQGSVGVSSPMIVDDGFTLNLGVLYDHDCINVYNNIDNDAGEVNAYKYKYAAPGSPAPVIDDLGGTGKYIEYGFTDYDMNAARRAALTGSGDNNNYLYFDLNTAGFADPLKVLDFTGYQRDEVYRFGIVFYDLKGRPSFTKWIGDIRFPKTNELLSTGNNSNRYELCTSTTAETMAVRILGIRFSIDLPSIEVDFPGLLAQLSGFQIVRCLRTENDSTIKAQGVVVPTHDVTTAAGSIKNTNYSSYNITSAGDYEAGGAPQPITTSTNPITGTNSTIDKSLVELLSPEIAINKSLSIDPTDFLEVFGHLDFVTADGINEGTPLFHNSYSVTSTYIKSFVMVLARITASWRRTIDEAIVSLPETKSPVSHTIGSTAFTARGFDDTTHADNPEMTYKGTSLVAKINSVFLNVDDGGAAGNEKAMYGRYRRLLGYSIYGGATYQERSYGQYIKAGEFTEISNIIIGNNVFNGDVYITPFNFLKLFFDYKAEYSVPDHTHSGQVLVAFPVESKINICYKLDNLPKYYTIPSVTPAPVYFVAERQSIGMSQYPNGYPKIGDLYRYNSAYSAQDISKVFIPRPFDFRDTEVNDIIVASSERKFNNEYSDSWLKFKYNNYIELEGEYGAITRLINNNERLLAFQPRGIAVLSVLERELVETNNTATLAVGTGGLLSRYDYMTKSCGTSLYDAITSTDLGLYFYDDLAGRVYRVVEALEAISDTKGMKSYHESNLFSSLITAYDKANREVLFSPPGKSTLCFSGYMDAFSSFYTFNPVKYITFDKYLISSQDSNKFHLHNVGNYNKYYGVNQASTLSLIVNPAKTNVMTFHIAEWMTDLTADGQEVIPFVTFDDLQVTNTYQDTGIINLNASSYLRRRFRKWRLNVIRDGGDGGRIRDSWIKAVFRWSQENDNKKLVVHPLNFVCSPTKLH